MSRPRLAYAARSSLCWGCTAYLICQIGLAFAIQRFPRASFVGSQECRQTASSPEGQGLPKTTILFLGSSRTLNGLNPHTLADHAWSREESPLVVLNHGMEGAGPTTELLMFRRLTRVNAHFDYVVIEIVPTLLASRSREMQSLPLEWLYPDELTTLSSHGLSQDVVQQQCWQYLIAPAYGHRLKLLNAAAPHWVPLERRTWQQRAMSYAWQPWGWKKEIPTPEELEKGLEEAWHQHGTVLQEFEMGAHPCAALRELLEACRTRQVPRALVLMPEGSRFRSWYSPAAWAQIEGFLEGLSREYAAPLINAREWVADQHFADSHHLLRSGAEVFSERLGKEFIRPWLAGEWQRESNGYAARFKGSP